MWFFVIALIAFLVLSFYQTILNKDKQAKLFYLLATIIATIAFIWGNIVYKVGIPTANIGYGFILTAIMLVLSWFVILKEELVLKIIKKYLIISPVVVEESQQQDTPIE